MPLNDFRSVHMPYCLARQPDGRYVVLNREYKPLGFKTKEFVTYSEYPISVRFKGLTPRMAARLSYDSNERVDMIFLYNDVCEPTHSAANMQRYLDRLRALAKLEIAEED